MLVIHFEKHPYIGNGIYGASDACVNGRDDLRRLAAGHVEMAQLDQASRFHPDGKIS